MNFGAFSKYRELILNGLFPPRCLRCGKTATLALCPACAEQTPVNKMQCLKLSGLPDIYYLSLYDDWVKRALHALKFKRQAQKGRRLGHFLLGSDVLKALPDYDYLLPVPLHWTKRWRRSFNQVDILFERLGTDRKIPYLIQVRRLRRTPPLFGLSRSERQTIMQQVFGSRQDLRSLLTGRRVLILDDIVTTGSTVGELARFLKSQGAAEVSVLALAYTALKG